MEDKKSKVLRRPNSRRNILSAKVASCNKCGEFEPMAWDFDRDGLWTCSCPKEGAKHSFVQDILKRIEAEGEWT